MELTQEEYAALRGLAVQAVANDGERARMLKTFTTSIEERNGVSFYTVLVRWVEADAPLPPGTNFPDVWPPTLQSLVEIEGRPVSSSDVASMLKQKARHPVDVLVTKDPAGLVGWTKQADFFK